MTNYTGYRSERFIYRLVGFPSYEEKENLGNITGGSLALSALNDLKATGAVSFVGTAPKPTDLLRLIYQFEDVAGDVSEHVLATMFGYCAEPTFDGTKWSGSMNMKSVLTIPASKKAGSALTVQAGTNAVQYVKEMLEDFGLKVSSHSSEYVLSNAHTFKSDDSYLSIANQLLDLANYTLMPDAYGTIQLQKYVEPTKRTPAWTFKADEQSIMRPELSMKQDWNDTYNAARVDYSTVEESLSAWALDIDPESDTSTVNTWERTLSETVSDLAGETTEERLESLKATAQQRLTDNLAKVEYVYISHAWIPLIPNDAVEVVYDTVDWRGAVTEMSMTLKTPFLVDLSARRFIRTDYKVEVGGSVTYANDSETSST